MCHITTRRDLQVLCSISAALGASTSLGSAAGKSKFLLVVPPGIFQSMEVFGPCNTYKFSWKLSIALSAQMRSLRQVSMTQTQLPSVQDVHTEPVEGAQHP